MKLAAETLSIEKGGIPQLSARGSLLLRAASLLFFCVVAGIASARTLGTHLTFSSTAPALTMGASAGAYNSQAITIQVQSSTAGWSLYSWATTGSSGSNTLAANSFSLVPDTSVSPPAGISFTKSTVNLGTTVLVGQGNTTNLTTLGRFSLAATIDPLTPTGTYSGTLYFQLTGPGNVAPQNTYALAYTVSVQPYMTISISPAMSFTAVTPGTQESVISPSCPTVVITTNSTATISVTFGLLASGSKSIPQTRTCIGFGASAAAALTNARAQAFGTNTTNTITASKGTTTYYLAGRVSTLIADQPGTYTGTLSASGSAQ